MLGVNGQNEFRFIKESGIVSHHAPGTSLPTTTLTRAELVDFAYAIGETRPEYVDVTAARQAGHPDVLATPTFLFCLTLRGTDPWAWAREGGLDMARTLHGEQSFRYHQLVHAGDRLTLSATSEALDPTPGGWRRVSRRTRVSNGDAHVATLVTTLAMREVPA